VKLEGPTFNEYVMGAVPVTPAVSNSTVAVEIPGLAARDGTGGVLGGVPPPPPPIVEKTNGADNVDAIALLA